MSHLADMIHNGRKTLYSGFSLFVDTQVFTAVDSKVAGFFAKVASIAARAMKSVYNGRVTQSSNPINKQE